MIVIFALGSALTFSEPASQAREAGFESAAVTVVRTDPTGTLTVPYEIGGTALPGKDYIALPGALSFADGQASAAITVEPLTNYRSGAVDETVTLTLPPGTAEGDTAVVTIRKDPAPKPLPDDARFFSRLDLESPALANVRTAVEAGSYPAARKALAAHFRTRPAPEFPMRSREPDFAIADAARQHRYTVSGITHDFATPPGGSTDWSFNPSTDAEWVWQLNRFAWWSHYVAAYQSDPESNAVYAKSLLAELADWLATSPLNVSDYDAPGSRWRKLETGIRLEGAWTAPFVELVDSPLLTDDLLVDWVKAFYLHARHLEANAELFTNRGATQALGLFVAGVVLPEFTEAAGWRQLGADRMTAMIAHDVSPDGSQREISPAYHLIVIGVIARFQELAELNDIPVDPQVPKALERLYDYLLFASDPQRQLPLLNDSFKFSIVRPMARAFELFPDRTDYQWIATGGEAGRPPATTSHLFPEAGQAVMRSSWEPNAGYLLMDAGPFGTSHGNEDKLSLSVNGYGVRHLIDCGPYDYEPGRGPRGAKSKNPYRNYSVSTHGKTAPLIDDLGQNRAAARAIHGIPANEMSPVVWRTSPSYDYAAATYGNHPQETWGPDQLRPGEVTRHVFFLKPATWVLIDAFRFHDDPPHTASALFQCSADTVDIDPGTKRLTIQLLPGHFDPATRTTVDQPQPSLTVTPLLTGEETVSVVKGQDHPVVSGYQLEKSTTWKKQPIPTVRYDRPGTTRGTHMAYVLAAAPGDHAPRQPSITAVATEPGTYGVHVSSLDSTADHTLLVALDGRTLRWQGRTYETPALIVTPDGIFDWHDSAPAFSPQTQNNQTRPNP